MQPYPKDFPSDAFLMVLDKVRGRDVSIPDLANAAWNVQGYAMGQALGGGPAITGGPSTTLNRSDEELLTEAIAHAGSPPGTVQGFFPWLLVVRLAIKILTNLVI